MTLQNNSLYDNFTVLYHFEFYSQILNIENFKICEDLINFFDLKKWLDCKILNLPNGLKRKLCISLSLLRRPDFLFYDEATNGIDIFFSYFIQKLLKSIKNEFGTIIIITTHLLKEIDFLCDEIGILENGDFIEYGNLKNIKFEQTKRILKIFPKIKNFDKKKFFDEIFEICEISENFDFFDGFFMFDIEEIGDEFLGELIIFFERKIKEGVIWNYEITRSSLERLFIDVVKDSRRNHFGVKN